MGFMYPSLVGVNPETAQIVPDVPGAPALTQAIARGQNGAYANPKKLVPQFHTQG